MCHQNSVTLSRFVVLFFLLLTFGTVNYWLFIHYIILHWFLIQSSPNSTSKPHTTFNEEFRLKKSKKPKSNETLSWFCIWYYISCVFVRNALKICVTKNAYTPGRIKYECNLFTIFYYMIFGYDFFFFFFSPENCM